MAKVLDDRRYPQRPYATVGAVVSDNGHFLLIKRGKEPNKGLWSIPGGAIELGETLYNAAVREIKEECSIDIEIERVLDATQNIVRDGQNQILYHYVIVDMIARYTGGTLKAETDAADCGWFTPEEVARMNIAPMLRAMMEKHDLIPRGGERGRLKNTFVLPQLAWHGVKGMEVTLPEDWQAQAYNMAGYDKRRLTAGEIKKVIAAPLGMPPLHEYARNKKEVVILFDDMARITRTAEIVPHVLAELEAAGIKDNRIRFICAGGSHGALNRADFVKKLGKDILKRFPVYNHHPFVNSVYAGTTTAGTKLSFNAEVMKCDLKIGIGSIVPHIMAGFGGGGKIVLPGVASYETIRAFHKPRKDPWSLKHRVSAMGIIDDNPGRKEIDEAAEIIGLDMKIDAIVNMWGETAELFAGDPQAEYAAGLKSARMHYLTPQAHDMDIVLVNTFAKANEAVTGLMIAFPAIRKGGDIVLTANAPDGQATHYLMGPFGNSTAGELPMQVKLPENVNRLIIFNEYPELASGRFLEDSGKIIMTDNRDEVMGLLKQNHGKGTKVAVYPNADIQYCDREQGVRRRAYR